MKIKTLIILTGVGITFLLLIPNGYCQENALRHIKDDVGMQSGILPDDAVLANRIKRLIAGLNNYQDQLQQMRASYELTHLGEAAVPYLLENLTSDGYVDMMHGNHSYTMKVLEKIGEPAVPRLIASVSDEMIRSDPGLVDTRKPSYVTSVVMVLGVIRDARAIPFYIKILTNSSAEFVQEAVLRELQNAGLESLQNGHGDKLKVQKLDITKYKNDLVPLLLRIVEKNNKGFNYASYHALRILGKLGDHRTIAALTQMRAGVSEDLKISLAIALYDLGSNTYLDVLDGIFKSKHIETVRDAAAELLYFEKDYKILIPKIILLMNRESSFSLGETTYQYIYGGNDLRNIPAKLPNICGEVLHVMTHQDFGASQGNWKKWWEKNKDLSREEWKKNRMEALKLELEKAKPIAREKILEGLVGMNGDQVVNVVEPYLDFRFHYPDGKVCKIAEYAMKAVFYSGSSRAKELLLGLLGNDDIWIGREALFILKDYQDSALIPHFLKFKQFYCQRLKEMSLGDCSQVESQIAGILLALGDRRGLEMLIELAGRNDYSQGAYIRQLGCYTQKSFGYDRNSSPEEKSAVMKQWRAWFENEGKHAAVKVREGFIDRDWRM